MGDTSGVDGIDLYADVEDFNEDLDASGNPGGNADGSNAGVWRRFDGMKMYGCCGSVTYIAWVKEQESRKKCPC